MRYRIPYVKLLRHTNSEAVKNGAVPEREPIRDTITNNEGDSSYEVRKQGNRTGTTKGNIVDTVEQSTGERNFWTNSDGESGDSGCPHYRRIQFDTTDETYIVGVHAWGRGSDSCPTPESGGNATEYIENQMGLTV